MPDFIKKLAEHLWVRVLLTYLMGGWIIMQIGEIMVPALKLPEWVNSGLAFILILGFPVAVLMSWMFHNAAKDAVKPETDTSVSSSNRQLDYLMIGCLGLVGIIISIRILSVGDSSTATYPGTTVTSSSDTIPIVSDSLAADPKSLAVLPFTDMSISGSESYFSDGMAEELLSALSRLDDLRLAGRRSTFSIQNERLTPQEVGKSLNVRYILEGSVRRQDDRVKVSAQLTSTDTGYTVWSDSYDRTLDNIFDIQEEIAQAITQELKIVIAPERKGQRLVRKDTDNQEAYALFLQGNALFSQNYNNPPETAIQLFEQALDLDQDFARAWAKLAEAYAQIPAFLEYNLEEVWFLSETYAYRALTLNPELAEAHAVLGHLYSERRQYLAMEKSFERAINLNLQSIIVLNYYAVAQVHVGHLEKARQLYQEIADLDPVSEFGLLGLAYVNMIEGNLDEADIHSKKALDLGYVTAIWNQGEIAGLRGDTDKAIQLIAPTLQLGGFVRGFTMAETTELVRGIFGQGEDRASAITLLDSYISAQSAIKESFVPVFLMRLNQTERAFDIFTEIKATFGIVFYGTLWGQPGEQARQHPAFRNYAETVGLIDYWRIHGWPDMCRPVDDSFECD